MHVIIYIYNMYLLFFTLSSAHCKLTNNFQQYIGIKNVLTVTI